MRSKFEILISTLLKKAKIKFLYEHIKIPYTTKAYYVPDFYIKDKDIYIEVKGYFRPEDRRKLLSVKKDNPDIDLRIWFMRDNYLTKAKKSKYSDWARKNNFKYHVGDTIPKDWFFNS